MPPGRYPVFVSLGMTILDELRFSHQKTVFDVPGGAGFFAVFGARLFKPPPKAGESWQLNLLLLDDDNKPCTRGLLEYLDDGFGGTRFSYTTPPLRPSTLQLAASSLLSARLFHFLALPDDLENQVSTLLRLRQEQGITEQPMIVWEPAPMGCDSANLTRHFEACKLVDVFSPNHIELHRLFEGKGETDVEFSPSTTEAQAKGFLRAGIGPDKNGVAVIRSGYHGALVLSNESQAEWLPAYYGRGSDKVVDATGAGNSFLGAFAVALQETNDPREAALRGAVAASYAIEQFGPPTLTASTSPSGEFWNGSDAQDRLAELRDRCPEVD
ncbi:Ribokinase-like protein [Xylaria sp. FL0933]|nr:Ribokinase-like protein [Xylaria sp. FL0933]